MIVVRVSTTRLMGFVTHTWRWGNMPWLCPGVDRSADSRPQRTPENRGITTAHLIADCRTGSPSNSAADGRIQG